METRTSRAWKQERLVHEKISRSVSRSSLRQASLNEPSRQGKQRDRKGLVLTGQCPREKVIVDYSDEFIATRLLLTPRGR